MKKDLYLNHIAEKLYRYIETKGKKPNTIVLPFFMYDELKKDEYVPCDNSFIRTLYGLEVLVSDDEVDIIFLNLYKER